MHLPDGYLSPETTIPAFVFMLGVWYLAFRKIQFTHNQQLIPRIALCAAFSFLVMMFNIPVVGGSSAHAVGAVLVAILVGPWAAILALSTTLLIQAFIFGDGGILALGINCLNMAVIMPCSGYMIYRLISGRALLGSRRNLTAVFVASYVGINLAAIAAGIEMGIQPLLFKTASGIPLYGFYSISVALSAMVFTHGLFAGPLDGIVSSLAMGYIVKFAPQLLDNQQFVIDRKPAKTRWLAQNMKLISFFAVVIILTPFGLLASGTAYGEWAPDEVKQILGYIPQGMARSAGWWHAVMPNYSLPKLGSNLFSHSLAYILSALVGIVMITILIVLSAKITQKMAVKR